MVSGAGVANNKAGGNKRVFSFEKVLLELRYLLLLQ
jgi:hypothetical protein